LARGLFYVSGFAAFSETELVGGEDEIAALHGLNREIVLILTRLGSLAAVGRKAHDLVLTPAVAVEANHRGQRPEAIRRNEHPGGNEGFSPREEDNLLARVVVQAFAPEDARTKGNCPLVEATQQFP